MSSMSPTILAYAKISIKAAVERRNLFEKVVALKKAGC